MKRAIRRFLLFVGKVVLTTLLVGTVNLAIWLWSGGNLNSASPHIPRGFGQPEPAIDTQELLDAVLD